MKCSDCGLSKAYRRKGVVWRLCKPCWDRLITILALAENVRLNSTRIVTQSRQ